MKGLRMRTPPKGTYERPAGGVSPVVRALGLLRRSAVRPEGGDGSPSARKGETALRRKAGGGRLLANLDNRRRGYRKRDAVDGEGRSAATVHGQRKD